MVTVGDRCISQSVSLVASGFHFLEVAVKLGLDEDYAGEELLYYFVFVLVVLPCDIIPLHVCLLIHGDLCTLCVPDVLEDITVK